MTAIRQVGLGPSRSSGPSAARRAALVGSCLASVLVGGCELQEITVVDLESVAVVETYVTLRETPGTSSIIAFLHGTTAGGLSEARSFDDALLRVTRSDGLAIDLAVVAVAQCVDTLPDNATGTCFAADPALVDQLAPGDALTLDVTLGAAGGSALGALTLPGDFALIGLGSECRATPDTNFDVRWSRSNDVWAYINETRIEGLEAALAPEGIEADDPLHLVGLSISASDTTVVFPSEFGVFDRFDLDQDLAVRLQSGLPDGTRADVSIAAVERNYVNWARGGNFNPSGLVRVSSLRGNASGVFGGAVVREFDVVSSAAPVVGVPDCP